MVGQRGWEQVELGLVKGAEASAFPPKREVEAPRPGPLELGGCWTLAIVC